MKHLKPKLFTYKQVIAVRGDLGMSPGKIAAQVAHGSIAAAERARKEKRKWLREWLREGQKKAVVKVGSEGELLGLKKHATELKIPCELIQDAGLTEVQPGSITVLAIGPAPTELVDKVTGNLPLL
jgi:PTH2 family peptidyl-tRNA hydrolase